MKRAATATPSTGRTWFYYVVAAYAAVDPHWFVHDTSFPVADAVRIYLTHYWFVIGLQAALVSWVDVSADFEVKLLGEAPATAPDGGT